MFVSGRIAALAAVDTDKPGTLGDAKLRQETAASPLIILGQMDNRRAVTPLPLYPDDAGRPIQCNGIATGIEAQQGMFSKWLQQETQHGRLHDSEERTPVFEKMLVGNRLARDASHSPVVRA
jgi:hypothetical protein